ncbi:MAG TPA: right-handed parallel beta-helix repeat-containing protein, partial [Pyrinomonadaceae bacterium]|nr:right-handed parallel beta-helix repeat-containing protein [Pyrinomonadaceae bacterium]
MFRLKFYAAMFAVIIGLLTTFNQTARAQACVTNPVVVNNLDSGAGSLRNAVIDVCSGGTISFSASMPPEVSLTTGQIVINKNNLTIQGPGADRLTIRNGASSRIFQVNGGLTISGLTIEDGTASGIFNPGTLTVADCVVRSNKGTGIFNSGNLTVVNSVLSDNEGGHGGAIHNTGTAAITNSTILHNSAKIGGGIYSNNSVTITNSSITGNTATGELLPNGNVFTRLIWGSAILNENGRATITNSTIAGNDDLGFAYEHCYIGYPTRTCPAGYGTAILVLSNSQGGQAVELNLINSTVTDNILIKKFSDTPASVTARNSIINGVGGDGVPTSLGYNLFVNNANGGITGDTTGNPRLGPLGYYGGRAMTRPLLTGSPAINAGNTATSPAADQRGASRVGAADIGAFELNNSANGGNFVVPLPDAFTEIAYSQLLVEGTAGFTYSLTGGALPTGISLSRSQSSRVTVSGRTAQTGVFAFSVTATEGTNSFVTNYSIRVLPSGAPPFGGCRSNVVVANRSDAGEGTLRQAVFDVCAGGTISFSEAARGKIHLTGGPLAINKNLTIAGPGADALTLRSAVGSGPKNNVVLVNPGVT